jgi:hypothetical protein
MDKAALAGVAFAPELRPQALVAFTRTLLGHYARTDLDWDFDRLWPAEYPGLRLIDRRFQGAFTGAGAEVDGIGRDPRAEPAELGDREQELIRRLSLDDSVHERLLEIQDRLDRQADGGQPKRGMNLIGRIVRMLPAEAMVDFERVLEMTADVLATIANRSAMAHGTAAVEACQDDASLNKLMLIMSRRLFSRQTPSATDVEFDQGVPAPSAKDERITEDFEAFRAELELLPDSSAQDWLLEFELPSEQLAVCLHYLVNHESAQKTKALYPTMSRILAAPGREELLVLKTYVDKCLAEQPQGGRGRKIARILDCLRATGATRVLRSGSVSEESVIEHFPRSFGLFVAALDLGRPGEVELLARVCLAVGAERVSPNRRPCCARFPSPTPISPPACWAYASRR